MNADKLKDKDFIKNNKKTLTLKTLEERKNHLRKFYCHDLLSNKSDRQQKVQLKRKEVETKIRNEKLFKLVKWDLIRQKKAEKL